MACCFHVSHALVEELTNSTTWLVQEKLRARCRHGIHATGVPSRCQHIHRVAHECCRPYECGIYQFRTVHHEPAACKWPGCPLGRQGRHAHVPSTPARQPPRSALHLHQNLPQTRCLISHRKNACTGRRWGHLLCAAVNQQQAPRATRRVARSKGWSGGRVNEMQREGRGRALSSWRAAAQGWWGLYQQSAHGSHKASLGGGTEAGEERVG